MLRLPLCLGLPRPRARSLPLPTQPRAHPPRAQINENKALSKAKRWTPYGKPGAGSQCKVCRSTLHQEGIYCQACAYQKGLCAMCGKQVRERAGPAPMGWATVLRPNATRGCDRPERESSEVGCLAGAGVSSQWQSGEGESGGLAGGAPHPRRSWT